MKNFKSSSNIREKIRAGIEKLVNNKSGKKTIIAGVASIVLLSSTIGAGIYQESITAYQVKIEDDVIVTINSEMALEEALKEIKEIKSEKYNTEVEIVDNFEIERVEADGTEVQSVAQLKNKIVEEVELLASAYSMIVDGKEVAYFISKEEAEKAISTIVDKVLSNYNSEEVVDHYLDRDVIIEEVKVSPEEILSLEKSIASIEAGGDEVVEHLMEPGENFWTIAQDYGVAMEEIEQANPDMDPRNVRDGELVKINTVEPYFNVAVVREVELVEELPFETSYDVDSSMYNDEERVSQEGENGEVRKEIRLVEILGEEKEREVLSEEPIKEPVERIIVKGSKERPSGVGTGNFRRPTSGRLSSGFGPRWGSMHNGIDIAAPTGTPIIASDNGTVTEVTYEPSGYGKKVVINHGNGYRTLYAHASEIHVSVGQVVSAGDTIASVGNTGRSTGPHLHFEVIRNGVPVNPQNYI